jgi:SAM-dependent methyltransferase
MLPTTRTYADAFGLQWNSFRKTQLDSYCGIDISQRRARRCIGPEAWAFVHDNPGIDVLEAGCGAGRFTEVLLAIGARVTSVDLSSAVEANQENFPQGERHRVLQADVLNLPFAPRQYHVVFCLGVIQHTPNPEATIAALFEQVRPGGWLVIDHYTHELSRYTKTGPLFRQVLRRLPPKEGMKWTERLVDFFFPLHRAVRGIRVGQALVSRVSPVLTYFHCYDLTDEMHRQWALLDTHDALTDWYKHKRTKGQIQRTLERLGGVDIACAYGGNGVEARCRRSTS